MKVLFVLIVFFTFTLIAADQKNEDLAAVVIRSEFHAGYNPFDNSEAELNKAAAINSALRLQFLMLHKICDSELKVCYALRILESQIAAARRLMSVSGSDAGQSQEHLNMLLKQQTELARQFRELQKQKAKPDGAAKEGQPFRSKTN